jgi:hypothetical protein
MGMFLLLIWRARAATEGISSVCHLIHDFSIDFFQSTPHFIVVSQLSIHKEIIHSPVPLVISTTLELWNHQLIQTTVANANICYMAANCPQQWARGY